MNSFAERKAGLERRAGRLAGRRLVRVRYYELKYEPAEPAFRRGDLDELDFGFDLDVEPAATFHVTWDDEFGPFGLTVRPGSLADQLLDAAAWDVTHGGGWALLLGARIARVTFQWASAETAEPPSSGGDASTICPRSLAIEFDPGPMVFAAAAQYDPAQDTIISPYDGLVVLFGHDLARRYRLGPESENPAP